MSMLGTYRIYDCEINSPVLGYREKENSYESYRIETVFPVLYKLPELYGLSPEEVERILAFEAIEKVSYEWSRIQYYAFTDTMKGIGYPYFLKIPVYENHESRVVYLGNKSIDDVEFEYLLVRNLERYYPVYESISRFRINDINYIICIPLLHFQWKRDVKLNYEEIKQDAHVKLGFELDNPDKELDLSGIIPWDDIYPLERVTGNYCDEYLNFEEMTYLKSLASTIQTFFINKFLGDIT